MPKIIMFVAVWIMSFAVPALAITESEFLSGIKSAIDDSAAKKRLELYGFYPGMTRAEVLQQARSRGVDVEPFKIDQPQPISFTAEDGSFIVSVQFFNTRAPTTDGQTVASLVQLTRVFDDSQRLDPAVMRQDIVDRFGEPRIDTPNQLVYPALGATTQEIQQACPGVAPPRVAGNTQNWFKSGVEPYLQQCPGALELMYEAYRAQWGPQLTIRMLNQRLTVLMGYQGYALIQQLDALQANNRKPAARL